MEFFKEFLEIYREDPVNSMSLLKDLIEWDLFDAISKIDSTNFDLQLKEEPNSTNLNLLLRTPRNLVEWNRYIELLRYFKKGIN